MIRAVRYVHQGLMELLAKSSRRPLKWVPGEIPVTSPNTVPSERVSVKLMSCCSFSSGKEKLNPERLHQGVARDEGSIINFDVTDPTGNRN